MKIKVFAIALLTIILPLVTYAAVASAQTFRTGDSSTIASDETIDGTAFVTGSSVDVAGKVNGDLYCAGQNVTISGEVDGDVLCAAQTINLTGKITGSVRMAGQTIAVGGNIARSATLAGQTITLDGAGQIGVDATLLGQTVTVNGKVARDTVIASSIATINTAAGINVTADVESLTLAKNAVIAGTLNYTSPQKLTMNSGAVVVGKVTYTKTAVENTKNDSAMKAYNPIGTIVWSLMLLASAVVFALLFPQVLHKVTGRSAASVSQTLLTILIGFVAGIIMPFAIVLIMITVLGIPFALVVLLAWLLVLSLSGAFTSYYIGRVLWKTQNNAVLVMLTGALVLIVLLLIPFVNILVGLLSLWYGTGAQLVRLKDMYAAPRYDTTVQKVSRAKS